MSPGWFSPCSSSDASSSGRARGPDLPRARRAVWRVRAVSSRTDGLVEVAAQLRADLGDLPERMIASWIRGDLETIERERLVLATFATIPNQSDRNRQSHSTARVDEARELHCLGDKSSGHVGDRCPGATRYL